MLLSCFLSRVQEDRESCWLVVCSALALLVAQVLADHHDPAVTADHLALVTDLLDAGLDLHGASPERMQVEQTDLLVPVDDPAASEVVR